MRRYILYMVGLVLSVATIGCVKTDDPSANQSGMVTLQLSNGTLTTRAVGTNDDTNNEDLIAEAQVFFFTSNADDATAQYSYYTSIGQLQEASISIPLSTEQLSSLFPSGTGYVYVIANYGSELATTGATLASLKATAITSAFNAEGDGKQASFIMDSDLVVVTRGTGNTITGEVFLTRAAAKVELTVNVAPLEQDGKTWVADTANMKLSFNNGVNEGYIDDGSDETAQQARTENTFSINGRGFTAVSTEDSNSAFVQSVPFYSYSTKWTAGAANEVYLELSIPWAVQAEGDSTPTYQTFYYQVPVNVVQRSLVRNAYYKLTLDVGVLGGLTEPVTVEPSYVVLDWGTNNVNVTLSRPKYLVVDENYVVMNNLQSYSVAYQSSDAVSVEVVSSTITGVNVGKQYAVSEEQSQSTENGVVTFTHTLDNTRGDDDTIYDYLVQTVVLKVYHTDDPNIYEFVTFVQYPALYVETETFTTKSSFIIGNSSTVSYWYNIGGANQSGNIYTIGVSAFDASTADYLIADPRAAAIDVYDFGGQAMKNTGSWADTDYVLNNYRPSVTGDIAESLVAPKFKVASGLCGNNQGGVKLDITTAEYRCAGYQEQTYPAGRWRVPTPAELNVIGKLVAEGKLEQIFKDGNSYMSSNGPYEFNKTAGTFTKSTATTSSSIRCVYDEWYWTDTCDIGAYVFGDNDDVGDF